MKNLKITYSITLILFAVLIYLDTIYGIGLIWYFLLIGLWFTMMAIGSFSLQLNFYVKAIISKPHLKEKKIAITFDDGPNPEYSLKILDILKRHRAKATFFCIGEHVEKHPEILKQIVEEGHDVGNHSFSHDVMIDFNSTEQWLQEIKKSDNAIQRVTGIKTALFRPPFGVTTPKLAKALKITEHKVIGWNIRSYDTILKNPKVIFKRLSTRIKPGAIILLHDKQANVIPVLEHLLQFLEEQEYKSVTINQLLYEN